MLPPDTVPYVELHAGVFPGTKLLCPLTVLPVHDTLSPTLCVVRGEGSGGAAADGAQGQKSKGCIVSLPRN